MLGINWNISEGLCFMIKTIPSEINYRDFISNFKTLLDEYFALMPRGNRDKEIFSKRFGLNVPKAYTLEEIGSYYNLTRERVRQIEVRHLKLLSVLMRGGVVKKRIACDDVVVQQSKKIAALVNGHYVVLLSELILSLAKKLQYVLSEVDKNYFLLYLITYGYESKDIYGHTTILKINEIDSKMLERVAERAYRILQKKVVWTSEFEINILIKKEIKNVPNNYVQQALGLLLNAKKCQCKADGKDMSFQVSFENLSSLADFAYRVLSESGVKLHYREIVSEINRRMTIAGVRKKCTYRGIRGQLAGDSRFSAIGKSGVWALQTWKLNTDTISEVIRKVFYFKNNPCTFTEVLRGVQEFRSDVREKSIATCLHNDLFLKLNDGRYILSEWRNKYVKNIAVSPKRPRKRYSGKLEVMNKVIQDLLSCHDNKMPLIQVVKTLGKSHGYSPQTLYQVISNNGHVFSKILDQHGKHWLILSVKGCASNGNPPAESKLVKILRDGETDTSEWKSSLRWDYKLNKVNKDLEIVAAKEIVALLNTKGGRLLIGVDDDGKVLGLKPDLSSLGKPTLDGFRLKLTEIIDNCIGKMFHASISIGFEKYAGDTEVCLIEVSDGKEPAYLKYNGEEIFYIRLQSSSKPLKISEAVKYIAQHWGQKA